MKQKIVIKVEMPCQKCRSKAMKIAVKASGVSKVEIQGAEKDQLVVTGDEVDAVKLTRSLRKKLHHASILSVEEDKDKKEKEKEKKEELIPIQWSSTYSTPYPLPYQVVAIDPYPSGCSIL